MKITLRELRQLIRESVQEQVQQEGIMDTVKGFFGGKKKTGSEEKPAENIEQSQPNIFKGVNIPTYAYATHQSFNEDPVTDHFYKWAIKQGWMDPDNKQGNNNIQAWIKETHQVLPVEIKADSDYVRNKGPMSSSPDVEVWARRIRNMTGSNEPATWADLLLIRKMAEILIRLNNIDEARRAGRIQESLRRMVRKEITRQLRSKR